MGKYLATLEPGLRILIPILDKVKYVQSLKGIDCSDSTEVMYRGGNGDSQSVRHYCG
jgi:hypothetical protein